MGWGSTYLTSITHLQHGDKWEAEKIYPAHEVMKKLGNAGLLGINKPVEFGGLGLDYKYQVSNWDQYQSI